MNTLAMLLVIVGAILCLVGGIWFLINCFRESMSWGLIVIFVPFGSAVFLVTHWREVAKPFILQLIGLALVLLATIVLSPELLKGEIDSSNKHVYSVETNVKPYKQKKQQKTSKVTPDYKKKVVQEKIAKTEKDSNLAEYDLATIAQAVENLQANKRQKKSRKVATVVYDDTAKIAEAFRTGMGNLQVRARGRVTKVLADDNKGSRHQKFIVILTNRQTLLIAHNIDLAPRIANLQTGNIVEFYGEYEYNNKGGVIHWTHRDPRGRHVGGWLKCNGKVYY